MGKKNLIIVATVLGIVIIAVGIVFGVKYLKKNNDTPEIVSESEKPSEKEHNVVVGKVRCKLNKDECSYKVVGLDSSYNNEDEVPVTISSTYNGLPITQIESKAFKDVKNLTKVEIESGVQEIGSGAFWNCTNLEFISIPNTVTTIGSAVFQGCEKLKQVTLPSGITELATHLFSGCSALEEITIPQNVTKIGSWCFEDCAKLTSITIPSNVKKIESYAFKNTESLKSIIFVDASGWRIVNGDAIDLSNPQNNVEYFHNRDYYLSKNIEK